MNEPIEFGRWYEQGGLHVMFDAKASSTSAVVRGAIEDLVLFVNGLDFKYFRTGSKSRAEIEGILREVQETGRPKRDALCFGDDRIRWISRLNTGNSYPEGPLYGTDALELIHNEQYGGKYPGES